jgi:hypothetical protein
MSSLRSCGPEILDAGQSEEAGRIRDPDIVQAVGQEIEGTAKERCMIQKETEREEPDRRRLWERERTLWA